MERMIEHCLGFAKDKPQTVEALATIVLAVVGIFQWFAMRKTNKTMAEQRKDEYERWKSEDEIRREENRPKANFCLIDCAKSPCIPLKVQNLGTTAFAVTGMQFAPPQVETFTVFQVEPFTVFFDAANRIFVPIGGQVFCEIDRKYKREISELAKKISLVADFEICLILHNAYAKEVRTDSGAYRITYSPGGRNFSVQSWEKLRQRHRDDNRQIPPKVYSMSQSRM